MSKSSIPEGASIPLYQAEGGLTRIQAMVLEAPLVIVLSICLLQVSLLDYHLL